MELEKLGSIEISSNQIVITDPTYQEIIDIKNIDKVLNGTYNCYCTRDWSEFGDRISSIKLIHEDYSESSLILNSNTKITTTSVVFCIMDNDYYNEIITKEKQNREEWFYNVMTQIDEYFIIDNKCIITQANFGNMSYNLKIFENNNHEKIGLEIPYLKI